ncbi:P63C domain-containing protein [Sphingorhabdus arenilitoris]|uniref:P63C domain-containing protein n=1 Tax=Sphingorhabdus arenilitoris TaxID=1490041 RepID=A0ABV8RGG0_9SPHN
MTDDYRSKGGVRRAAGLSPERRSEIAKKAAESRWSADLPEADFEGEFLIGDKVVACAVLRDERRIITQATFLRALGRSRSPKAGTGVLSTVDELPFFLQAKALKPFIDNELEESTKPIFFRTRSGKKGAGYNARLILKVADVYIAFGDSFLSQEKGIPKRYEKMIFAAKAIKSALAEIGIVALVDEATGYQDVRNRLALQEMFEAVLRKELAAWAKRFPDEFYKQIYRLRGWEWRGRQINPPQIVAHYTNDFIYDRIAPGLRKELENRMPKTNSGKKKGRLHQLFTDDIGHPLLAQHVHMVTMFMKAAGSWDEFKINLDKVSPKQGDNYELSLEGAS